jgi:hypothetical protein
MKNIRKAITAQGDDETMNRKTTSVFLRGMLAALVISAVFAGSAGASPAWNFEAKELTGTETVLGGAIESSMTVPGLTTKCENFLYKLTIKNEGKIGKGELTEMPLYNCTTNSSACAVKTIGAETLPWPAHLTKVEPSSYIVIENVKVGIAYSGAECVLKGIAVKVTGSAGGLVDNAAETATFNSSTLKATKTELKALGSAIEWNGVFPTEAFQWHREQALTVS